MEQMTILSHMLTIVHKASDAGNTVPLPFHRAQRTVVIFQQAQAKNGSRDDCDPSSVLQQSCSQPSEEGKIGILPARSNTHVP